MLIYKLCTGAYSILYMVFVLLNASDEFSTQISKKRAIPQSLKEDDKADLSGHIVCRISPLWFAVSDS